MSLPLRVPRIAELAVGVAPVMLEVCGPMATVLVGPDQLMAHGAPEVRHSHTLGASIVTHSKCVFDRYKPVIEEASVGARHGLT